MLHALTLYDCAASENIVEKFEFEERERKEMTPLRFSIPTIRRKEIWHPFLRQPSFNYHGRQNDETMSSRGYLWQRTQIQATLANMDDVACPLDA